MPIITSRALFIRIVLITVILVGTGGCDPAREFASGGRADASACTCRSDEQDLAALRKLMQVVNHTHYGNSFPEVPIRWASGPANYYAFTSYEHDAIYFVAPNFRQDWDYNFKVVRHEMAHYAVGPSHGHDAVWKREFRRLQAPATSTRFNDVRAAR